MQHADLARPDEEEIEAVLRKPTAALLNYLARLAALDERPLAKAPASSFSRRCSSLACASFVQLIGSSEIVPARRDRSEMGMERRETTPEIDRRERKLGATVAQGTLEGDDDAPRRIE